MSLLTRRAPAADRTVVDPTEIARTLAIDAVDDALRSMGGRERFGAAEATRIVDEVRLRVDETVLGPEVTRVLDGTVATIDRDTLVDATRLVDALLDLRTAVRH